MESCTRKVLCATILMVILGVLLVGPIQAEGRSITVTGDAEIHVVPDEVILTLGVETWDKDLGIAKADNDARIRGILNAAQEFQIDPEHIQTDYLNIEPSYRYEYEQEEFIGYFVRKTVVVTLKDLSKFEDLLTAVLEAGASHVHGIEFRTTELRKYRDEARALAIAAAQEKAAALAAELDQMITRPSLIEEKETWWASSYSSWWGSRPGYTAQNVIQSVGTSPADTGGTLAPGQITVSARVSVSFELW